MSTPKEPGEKIAAGESELSPSLRSYLGEELAAEESEPVEPGEKIAAKAPEPNEPAKDFAVSSHARPRRGKSYSRSNSHRSLTEAANTVENSGGEAWRLLGE